MNHDLTQVEADIKRIIAESNPEVFVVEIELHHGNKTVLSLWVDTDDGITIDKCARISRSLNTYFEEDDPFEFPFRLEVSSPGIGRPLRLIRQYHKSIGRKLKVTLEEGEVVSGKLESVSDEIIVLRPTSKKTKKSKKEVAGSETVEVPLENIKEAIVEISFD